MATQINVDWLRLVLEATPLVCTLPQSQCPPGSEGGEGGGKERENEEGGEGRREGRRERGGGRGGEEREGGRGGEERRERGGGTGVRVRLEGWCM